MVFGAGCRHMLFCNFDANAVFNYGEKGLTHVVMYNVFSNIIYWSLNCYNYKKTNLYVILSKGVESDEE